MEWQSIRDLLSGLQCDDDENWASVHSTYAAGVAHKIVQDGCELSPHLLDQSSHKKSKKIHFNGLFVIYFVLSELLKRWMCVGD